MRIFLFKMKKSLLFVLPPITAFSYYLFAERDLPKPVGPPYQPLPKVPYEDHPNKHIITKIPKTICIIGAGLSGLIGAKILRHQGYDIEVIDKNPGPGGV